MPKGRLRTTLQQILALTLPVAGAGCGLDRSGYEPVPCPDTVDSLAGLSLAEPADSITLRSWQLDRRGDPATLEPIFSTVAAEVGTPCVTATDPNACAAAVASAAAPTEGFVMPAGLLFTVHDLVVTRGDVVEVVQDRTALQALLGPIDTPHDAVWWVTGTEGGVECGNDEATVGAVEGGHEVLVQDMVSSCDPVEVKRLQLFVAENGDITELATETAYYDPFICIGRRPAGLIDIDHTNVGDDVDDEESKRRALGAFWAGIAHLEAASIHAFATLCRELVHHGAPRALVEGAQRALRDEVKHARLTGDMARRHGATPQKPTVHTQSERSLLALALENATEGCVRETFGALLGLWQAQRAEDARTRAVMQRVAEDEVQHAELAWAVHRWLWPRLAPAERQQVRAAQQQALADLSQVAAGGPGLPSNAAVGWPSATDAAALAQRFVQAFQPA